MEATLGNLHLPVYPRRLQAPQLDHPAVYSLRLLCSPPWQSPLPLGLHYRPHPRELRQLAIRSQSHEWRVGCSFHLQIHNRMDVRSPGLHLLLRHHRSRLSHSLHHSRVASPVSLHSSLKALALAVAITVVWVLLWQLHIIVFTTAWQGIYLRLQA